MDKFPLAVKTNKWLLGLKENEDSRYIGCQPLAAEEKKRVKKWREGVGGDVQGQKGAEWGPSQHWVLITLFFRNCMDEKRYWLLTSFVFLCLLVKLNFIFGEMCGLSLLVNFFLCDWHVCRFCPFADSTPGFLISLKELYIPDSWPVSVLESFLWLLIARRHLSEGQSWGGFAVIYTLSAGVGAHTGV